MSTCQLFRGVSVGLLVMMVALLTGAATEEETLVERISFAPMSGGEGYVVRVHAANLVNAYWSPRVGENNVVEFKVFNADLAPSFQQDSPAGLIEDVHVEKNGSHLVFQFRLASDVSVEAAAYRDRLSNDVLVSLRAPGYLSDSEPQNAEVESLQPRAWQAREERPMSAVSGSRWKLDTIVIDAGHGGRDPGAIGAGGVREKDVTLAVALQLGEYIERYLDGVRVVYTREDDRFVDLEERGRIANEAGGKLFISIHANSARNRSARGAETYFLGPAQTEAARRVMERENRVIHLEDNPEQYEAFDESNLVMQTMAHSAFMRTSEQLGDLIQRQFAERVHRNNRGVKQAGFIVLWAASMPAVLVELGFLSNPEEARFLASSQGQVYMASAIFRAVREYKERYEKGIAVHN